MRRTTIVILLVLASLNLSSKGSAETLPASFFGMHIQLSKTPWPNVGFGSYRLWDDGTAWATLNPSNGVYNWAPLDAWVSKAQANGVELTYTFGRTPTWASSVPTNTTCGYAAGACEPPANNAYFSNFVTALVTRYKGKIKYYEMWNEPNYNFMWQGTTAQLVTLTGIAANIIHSTDPNAKVVSPGSAWVTTTTWEFLDQYLTAGAGPYLDCIALHIYTNNTDPSSALSIIDNNQSTENAHGLYLPLIITEGGWGTDTVIPNQDTEAAFLVQRYMLVATRSEVQSFFWYQWDNTQVGTLWDSTNGIHKAGIAYAQLTSWLTGASANGCSKNASSTWTCSYTLANGNPAIAVWNSSASVNYVPGSQYTQALAIDGTSSSIDGSNSYTVGNKPLLFTGTSAPTISARLSVTPDTGVAPVAVSATVTATVPSGLSVKSTSIAFGDGTTVNAASGSHTYAKTGTYTVEATVTDNLNHSVISSKTVTVTASQPPQAALSVSPASGTAPLVVSASSAGSKAPSGSITSSSINFGDGTVVNSSTAAHTYSTAGTYTVTAMVEDNLGVTSTATVTVTVTSASPTHMPDLAEPKVNVSGSFSGGGIIRITDTVSNIGTSAPISVTWFYLATSAAAQSGQYIGSRGVPSLPAGTSNTATTQLTLPNGLSGTYYIVACANSEYGSFTESTRANNCSGSNAMVVVGADLAESKVSVTGAFVGGGIVRITDTVSNIGNLAPISVTWFYLANSAKAQSGQYIGSRGVPSLPAGTSNTATTQLTLPNGLSGTYYIVACANSEYGSFTESNRANNCSGSNAMVVTH